MAIDATIIKQHAADCLVNSVTNVYMDSGVENLNKDVDNSLEEGAHRRVIAQIDVTSSNSMIEARWRSLKIGWLFINHRDSIATLRKLVEFCVNEHNKRIPHSAFHGQMPDEMCFGRGATIADELAEKKREAQRRRIEHNQNITCGECARRAGDTS